MLIATHKHHWCVHHIPPHVLAWSGLAVPVALGLGLSEVVALGEGVLLDVPLSVPVGLLVEVPVGDGEVVPVTLGLRLRLAVVLGVGVGVWLAAKYRHTFQWDIFGIRHQPMSYVPTATLKVKQPTQSPQCISSDRSEGEMHNTENKGREVSPHLKNFKKKFGKS
jgi:hypothetical protein